MKKFGILVAMVSMFAFEGYAEKPALSREPFVVSTGKLINYLQLSSTQVEEVAEINAYFIEQQDDVAKASAKKQDQKMYDAVYGNLKLMKKALTADQYRKYVTLLNITNNNNRILGHEMMSDVYLADNAK